MNAKRFARQMLFIPYLIAVITWLKDASTALFIGIFAFIPYTIFVVSLLLWSKGKTLDKMKNMYTYYAPLWLTGIVAILYLLLITSMYATDLISMTNRMSSMYASFLIVASVVSIPASLFIGYFCCGIFFVLYETLYKIGLIHD